MEAKISINRGSVLIGFGKFGKIQQLMVDSPKASNTIHESPTHKHLPLAARSRLPVRPTGSEVIRLDGFEREGRCPFLFRNVLSSSSSAATTQVFPTRIC